MLSALLSIGLSRLLPNPLTAANQQRSPTAQTEGPFRNFAPGFGVNIHFTDPQPGEMARLKESGVGWIRMDLIWSETEKAKGQYDFSAYDRLMGHLDKAGIRALFILDYGNAWYQEGAPRTPEAQEAFARFAAAAVARYKGRGVVWEVWNEPNILPFWAPKPNVNEYMSLVKKTVPEMRKADSNAVIIAPGTSGFDWEFLESCFGQGLLELVDGISVHPYRLEKPETVWNDYSKLRALMESYGPVRPIICSEWGYSTRYSGINEKRQASYLARAWTTNFGARIPISIFYDWRDDGDNPTEVEHHFGIVYRDFRPKPAFAAAQKTITMLKGLSPIGAEDGADSKMVVRGKDKAGKTFRFSWLTDGDAMPEASQTVGLSATRLKSDHGRYEPNVLVASGFWKSQTVVVAENRGQRDAEVFIPMVELAAQGLGHRVKSKTSRTIFPRIRDNNMPALELHVRVVNATNAAQPARSRFALQSASIPFDSLSLVSYVDNKEAAQTKVSRASSVGNLNPDKNEAMVEYRFGTGWHYKVIKPSKPFVIPANAVAASIWVKMDKTKNFLRSRFSDASGQVFQIDLGTMSEPTHIGDWRLVRIPLDGSRVGVHWGGDGSGVPSGQLKWDGLLLVDSASREKPESGTLRFSNLCYELKLPVK